ncbi:hypothetical protein L6164_037191 [Bauhinia variegata]|uniref:Uncharacterized protein n=1 Tax=Bauhinia variegata TaxID=167791 RepID=A0ACB9KK40_BAUVA|nr:hypothetical protein L6164_037191 [Bauhinia variegata]
MSSFILEGSRENAIRVIFQPREDQLIGFYLFNKIAGKDDDNMVIPECDLYGTQNPWEIWQELYEDSNCKAFSEDNELYLFTSLKIKGRSDSRFDRRVGFGTWAAEDSPKPVLGVTQKGERVRGSKKRYRFEKRGSEHHGTWIMIEYSLQHVPNPNNVVLCKLKKNERVGVGAAENRSQLVLKDGDAVIEKRKNGNEKENLYNDRNQELQKFLTDEFLKFVNKISNKISDYARLHYEACNGFNGSYKEFL